MSFLEAVRAAFPDEPDKPTNVTPIRRDDPFANDPLAPSTGGWAETALNNEVEILRNTLPGGINNQINTSAFCLGQIVAGGHLDYQTCFDALYQAAAQASSGDVGGGWIENSLRSGFTSGMQKPRDPKPKADVPAPVIVPAIKDDGTWRTPDPLHNTLPEFPTAALGWLEPATLALSEQLQTPPDLVAMLLLATAGAAVRGRLRLKVTTGWEEPLNLYVAVVLGAGETKSPALSHLTQPLRDIEAALIEESRAAIADAEQKIRMQEKRVRQAEDRAVKAGGPDRFVAEEEARAEAQALLDLPHPVTPRLLLGDVTPEGLVKMLAEQGGAIASLTAEGGLFDTFAAGRYSNGLANLDAILQAHDGREPILVDRKTGDPIRVERPCLALGLAVQPQVLEAIGDNDAAVGRGFLARFLYAIPRSRVGTRSVDNRVDSPRLADFHTAISGTYRLASGSSADFADASLKGLLTMSSSSLEIHREYRRTLEARRHPYTGDLAEMVAWTNKLDGQLARIAGLLHLLDLTCSAAPWETSAKSAELEAGSLTVGENVTRRAVEIADYLIAHARAAHRMMSPAHRDLADERQVLGWIAARKNPLADFSERDAFNALRGRVIFHESEAVVIALDKLAVRGYLAPIEPPTDKKPGRPGSPRYRVNPAITQGLQQ